MSVAATSGASSSSWTPGLAHAAEAPSDVAPAANLEALFAGDGPGAGLLRQNVDSLGDAPASRLPPEVERAIDEALADVEAGKRGREDAFKGVPDPLQLRPQVEAAFRATSAIWTLIKDPEELKGWTRAIARITAAGNAADPMAFGDASKGAGLLDRIVDAQQAPDEKKGAALADLAIAALEVSPNKDVQKAARILREAEKLAFPKENGSKDGGKEARRSGVGKVAAGVALALSLSDDPTVQKVGKVVDAMGAAFDKPSYENLGALAGALLKLSDDPNVQKAGTAVQAAALAYQTWATGGNPAGYAAAALTILGLIDNPEVQKAVQAGVAAYSVYAAQAAGGPVGWAIAAVTVVLTAISVFGRQKEKWNTREFSTTLDISGDGVPDKLDLSVSTKKNHQWIYYAGASGIPVERARFALVAESGTTATYRLDLDADFASINPSVGAAQGAARLELTAEQYANLVAALGGTSGELGKGDSRIEEFLRPYLNTISLRYPARRGDPNLWTRFDLDGDGTSDLVRQGRRLDGLRNQGDGLFSVIRLGEVEGKGHMFTLDRIEDAPIVAATGPAWLAYGASHPDLMRAYGPDAGALYMHYRDHGRAEGRTIDFDPAAWLEARPDVAAAMGGDSWSIIGHYIVEQKALLDAEAHAARPIAISFHDGAMELSEPALLGPGFEPKGVSYPGGGEAGGGTFQGFVLDAGQAQRIEAILAGAPALAANDPRWAAIREALATPSPVPIAMPEEPSIAGMGY